MKRMRVRVAIAIISVGSVILGGLPQHAFSPPLAAAASQGRNVGLTPARAVAASRSAASDACNGAGKDPCLPAYFTGSGHDSMNAKVNADRLRIMAHIACPKDNSETEAKYKYFPFTICTALNPRVDENSTYTRGKIAHFIWADRYNNQDGRGRTASPNPISPAVRTSDGKRCVMQFSTKAKADAATKARVAYTVGFPAHDRSGFGYLDITEAAGIPDDHVWFYDSVEGVPDLVDKADTLCTDKGTWPPYAVMPVDSVVLTYGRLSRIRTLPVDGVELDWEVLDGHSCAETLATQRAIAKIVHAKGYKLAIYTNPMDARARPYDGYCRAGEPGANLDAIMAPGGPDYFDLMVLGRNWTGSVIDELNYAIGAFAAPPFAKLQVIALISKISVSDAAAIREAVVAKGMAGIDIFLNRATAGGQCSRPTNRKIAALTGLRAC